ncbi:peptidyl-prolyl cis-trans isomerase [Ruegeria marina]|uniref:peptidylprolyl isomerase n=1 Tax=Ruegeria marina TaxID=639004 RepID=A0A1G7DHK5_9RHOB|nr:peptidylprolyl isomerase [Ruegeria marina]SDE51011.1 PPIC-type PPIASE domain-containing protein [Ruegeria marina]
MISQKILLSPLLHFFVLGAGIFAFFAVLDSEPAVPRSDAIVLTQEEAGRLVQQFTATWNRPPTELELEGMMQSWALEEANVREALALGLDRGDTIIRQRLNQKMQFLAESGAAILQPDDAELQRFIEANPDRFTRPAHVAFEQVMLPPDQDASDILKLLETGADPSTLGTASLLPESLPLMPAPVIDRTFGEGFHTNLLDAPIGEWRGPVQSGYGPHVVRVTGRSEAIMPPLSEIRDRVVSQWRAARMEKMRESFGHAMLERYSVTLPDARVVLGQ